MKTNSKESESLSLLQKELGLKLSELRIKKGYHTQVEFANAYKLPPVQYWRLENGKANITLRSLHRLATIHDIKVSDLFNFSSNVS